eukprot:m.802695 g.802695  ORF g.802695 m.802695 type:complete len:227 (+) comp59275_c0_seq20:1718-2398(+)
MVCCPPAQMLRRMKSSGRKGHSLSAAVRCRPAPESAQSTPTSGSSSTGVQFPHVFGSAATPQQTWRWLLGAEQGEAQTKSSCRAHLRSAAKFGQNALMGSSKRRLLAVVRLPMTCLTLPDLVRRSTIFQTAWSPSKIIEVCLLHRVPRSAGCQQPWSVVVHAQLELSPAWRGSTLGSKADSPVQVQTLIRQAHLFDWSIAAWLVSWLARFVSSRLTAPISISFNAA